MLRIIDHVSLLVINYKFEDHFDEVARKYWKDCKAFIIDIPTWYRHQESIRIQELLVVSLNGFLMIPEITGIIVI